MQQCQLETKLAVLEEFSEYLDWTVRENRAIDPDTRDHLSNLLGVLETYASELCRQIEAKPATTVYFRWVTVVSLQALSIKCYLFDRFPGLAIYRPCDEPKNVQQETVRHLLDAIEVLNAAKAEMAGYLDSPHFPGLCDQLLLATMGEQASIKDRFTWEAENESIIWQELMSTIAQ